MRNFQNTIYASIILILFFSGLSFGQSNRIKKVKSTAPYIDIKTKGIDNLKILTSESDELVMEILDEDGIGVIENFSCNDYNCVLTIETEVKIKNPNINKMNQLTNLAATKVSAILKIPAGKKVAVFGEIIDITSEGYDGLLRVLIESGIVKLEKVKGVTEVTLFSGNVIASIDDNSLDVKTRKGKLSLNDEFLKSTLKKRKNNDKKLIIRTINGNIILTSTTH